MNHEKVTLQAGLYFVGVPIGTARDITLRALDVLASADILAAEDTRSLRRLMDIHAVPLAGRKIYSLHDHSKQGIVSRLTDQIADGKSVAYASEAGMPLIADPGYELGVSVGQAGYAVTCAPGPSAVLTALVLSGLPTDAFTFAGFLPNAAVARQKALAAHAETDTTLVFYESPKRLWAMLENAASVLGNREAAVCRELTKKFEEIRKGSLTELAEFYRENSVKGEIVVVIDRDRSEKITQYTVEDDLKVALQSHSLRDAVDMIATSHGVPRRQIYKMALDFSKR